MTEIRHALAPSDPAYPGQKHYTPAFLNIYDWIVLGLYSRWVWRCPAPRLLEQYNRGVRRRHLDVGPGTGYFLEHARLPANAQLTLLDANPHVLAHATARLARLRPGLVQADICKPLPIRGPFDSIALNYVLHCLPGPMPRRAATIANLAAILEPDGVLFGATVLGTPELHTRLSRWAMRENNKRGIFDNAADTEADLRAILSACFGSVEIHVIGSVAVFSATRLPKKAPGTATA